MFFLTFFIFLCISSIFLVILSIFFILLESVIFVSTGALQATPGMEIFVMIQIAIGGIFILFMDEIVSKYGFGSGISLFIAAGVSQQIFIQLFRGTRKSFSSCTYVNMVYLWILKSFVLPHDLFLSPYNCCLQSEH